MRKRCALHTDCPADAEPRTYDDRVGVAWSIAFRYADADAPGGATCPGPAEAACACSAEIDAEIDAACRSAHGHGVLSPQQ